MTGSQEYPTFPLPTPDGHHAYGSYDLTRELEAPTPIPDSVEPVLAYRAWFPSKERLHAIVCGEEWEPRKAMEARCLDGRRGHTLSWTVWEAHDQRGRVVARSDSYPKVLIPEAKWLRVKESVPYPIPEDNCTCGVYAVKQLGMLDDLVKPYLAVGTVKLWGKIIECERGYRAQYAYPHTLIFRPGGKGPTITQLKQLAEIYGVRVRVPTPPIVREAERAMRRTRRLRWI